LVSVAETTTEAGGWEPLDYVQADLDFLIAPRS